MLRRCLHLLLAGLALGSAAAAPPPDPSGEAATLIREGLAAEARLDPRGALERFLRAEPLRPDDAFLLQKIARQYSDLTVDLGTTAERRAAAERALAYARRAVALAPHDPVNVLSVAICHGKLGLTSDTRGKVEYSRLVRSGAEQALALDPNYAWAHHVLGRWHHEVAALGATARFFVRLFYGGLPGASAAEAVRHLTRATELEPGELAHWLELGFAHAVAGDAAQARACLTRGLAMPTRGVHDESAKARARAALAELGL